MERHVSLFQEGTHREEDNSFVFPTCDIILKTFQVIAVFEKWGPQICLGKHTGTYQPLNYILIFKQQQLLL